MWLQLSDLLFHCTQGSEREDISAESSDVSVSALSNEKKRKDTSVKRTFSGKVYIYGGWT